ncbi:hypothetical protein BO86DRAFT_400508 [Aspergillus japonicus CBS 114.51]|uniref:Uncharacterized protein n=1 Tax=Aspergillus japonicus CBS 114.51 TaxID=1448312 RepID=A0A8T8WZU8_ASPJA|nr:hypothetical protein BO86DRAFT_400508 [Aspergillus japonicus CBS 114.51]RAH80829.1 hypothetical protein BO86DRAFT_400508 [Aspergillus japonicus CBS 114.51]
MAEVHALMGVSRSKDDVFPMFSKHILRVEISGPNEDHLSVIDVPGTVLPKSGVTACTL